MIRLAVVGGGIAGLAAAWQARDDADVTVVEADHLGGKLQTGPFAGRPIDTAADAFLARSPAASELASEVGLGDDLVSPAAGRAALWTGGRLRGLPGETVLGVPRRLGPVARSGLIGPLGVGRAALDLVLPSRDPGEDLSVRELVARRMGRRVADRLVDPLVGSIHAGRTDELGAAATTPQLLAAARSSRSLMLALRRSGPDRHTASGPVFLAPKEGMQALTDAVVGRLRGGGTRFVAATATRVERHPGGGVRVTWRPADAARAGPAERSETFDAVVLAVPATDAAGLLGPAAPAWLAQTERASVTLVTMEYRADAIDAPPGCSGILVPRPEGRLMTACSFASTKWPHWARPGRVLLRVSCGRSGDERPRHLDDGALVDRLAAELAEATGAEGLPLDARVSRWDGAFPTYGIGHLDAVDRVEAEVEAAVPGVRVAGASYHGVGVPACIASGRRAAASLVAACLS